MHPSNWSRLVKWLLGLGPHENFKKNNGRFKNTSRHETSNPTLFGGLGCLGPYGITILSYLTRIFLQHSHLCWIRILLSAPHRLGFLLRCWAPVSRFKKCQFASWGSRISESSYNKNAMQNHGHYQDLKCFYGILNPLHVPRTLVTKWL